MFACDECDLSFDQKESLAMHLKECNKQNFKCDECSLSFYQKDMLLKHIKTHKEKLYSCPDCDKSFLSKIHYENHISSHKTIDQFKCDSCDKVFKTKKGLSIHRNIHTQDSLRLQFRDRVSKNNREIVRNRHSGFDGIRFKNENGENMCYINASVNGLASISKIRETIINSDIPNSPIINIFKSVILTNGIHDIKQLKSLVGRGKYLGTRQQDACEFLEDLLTKLNKIFPDLKSLFSMITVTTRGCQLGH